ncbi:MAG: ABC transporter substrate-binding protein [Promethearchaeota archaeon]
MKKRTILFVIFLFLLISTFDSTIKIAYNKSEGEFNNTLNSNLPPISNTFLYGSSSAPNALDPVDCVDRSSSIIIDQVVETLFTYNYSNPSLPLIPLLATSYDLEPVEELNITVYLRQGVTFHDGSEFNSTVVKWNFDRMSYWWNISGLLPSYETLGYATYLGYWEDGITPIFNKVEIVNQYAIKLVLTKPNAGVFNLLTHSAFAMLSMNSTPFFNKLNLGTDQIIGTGPFVFEHYFSGLEARFHAFESYWREKANIERMIFAYFTDSITLNMAMLVHDIDFMDNPLPSYIDMFKADSDLVVIDDGKTNSLARYLVFNDNTLNKTLRKAFSYAVNYSDIIDKLHEGTSIRLKSPIPPGILYSNTTLNYPYFNITKAREIIQSIGHGNSLNPSYPGPDDSNWNALADTGKFNVSMWVLTTSQFHIDLFNSLNVSLRKIGVNLSKKETDWITWIDTLQLNPNWTDIWTGGWLADYNDPYNYINSMFSNTSIFRWMFGFSSDSYLQNFIELGTEEVDPILRNGIYNEIQRYLVEELMPMAWLDVSKMYDVHHIDFTGFNQNVLQRTYFYYYKWKDSYSINIISSGDTSFVKGSTGNNITWLLTAEELANPSYDIYINRSPTNPPTPPPPPNETGTWQNNVPIIIYLDDLSVGTYKYKIYASNTYKLVYDIVNVEVIPKDEDIPIEFIILISTISGGAVIGITTLVLIWRKKKRKL